jgi:DNA topoisomerase VI subunit B
MASPKLARMTFRTSRLLDFCSRKELVAQIGHEPAAWPLVVVKELVDNALDACEEASVPPEITVDIDNTGIAVRDNGPGIPATTINGVLDFAIRVSSREAYVSPSRGAQGNALKTLVAMPFVLDESRGRVEITARGARHEIQMEVDRIRQEPHITHTRHEAPDVKTGTVVCLHWPNPASRLLRSAGPQLLQMAEAYACLNPHLTLTIAVFGKAHRFEATTPRWTKWGPSDPTCPLWYKAEHLGRLVAAYLATPKGPERTVREFVSEFRALSGSAKQKEILEATGLHRLPLSALANGHDLDGPKVRALLAAMQAQAKPVKPALLGIIGEAHLRQRVEVLGGAMDTFQYVKRLGVQDQRPYVVEFAFAAMSAGLREMLAGEAKAARAEQARKKQHDLEQDKDEIEDLDDDDTEVDEGEETDEEQPQPEDDGEPEPMPLRVCVLGINWSPSIGVNPYRQLGPVGQSLDSVLAELRAGREEPVIVVLHLAYPRVEFSDRGKSSVIIEDPDR